MDAAESEYHARGNSAKFYSENAAIRMQPSFGIYPIVKRAVDVAGAVFGLIFFMPVMLAASVLIRFTSHGPAIYKQIRIGRGGRRFCIYKFRTMVDGADNLEAHLSHDQWVLYQKNRKLDEDPRITPVGAKLRASSFDELPQLLNVLKGDMSLVGPRPMLPEEVGLYGERYAQYIQMRPGITGLWQISHRHETQMDIRASIDAKYFERRGLRYDFQLLLATGKAVVWKKGAC